MKKISIQDIAKDLNLSRNTVSKALSNSESVAYETKQRIIKRAVEMGYKKLNPELKVQIEDVPVTKTGNIAILAHREIAEFWNRITMGISKELGKHSYNLLFNFTDKEEENKLVLPANIANKEVDGIILLSVFKKEYIHKILETNIPVVFLDMPVDGFAHELNGDVLIVEGENSVYDITKHIIESGRKRLSFIGDIGYCKTVYDRWRGFTKALYESNIQLDEDICFVNSVPNRYYGENELNNCFEGIKSMPDAFVCSSDVLAILTIKYLKEKGYKVPEDIAVTGFDDERDAVVIEPPLTTVHIENEQVGVRLVQELIWRIENPDMPFEKVIIDSKVIFRKSC